MSTQLAAWMFTINNPTDDMVKPNAWPNMKYCVWQLEKGEHGTPHWQGYITFTRSVRLSWLKKHCSATAHFESRRGTHEQARSYCMKEDTRLEGPFEHGTKPEQGKRNDLEALKQLLDSGASTREVADTEFRSFIKFSRGIQTYRRLMSKPRNFKTQVTVLVGKTGVGKSRILAQTYPDAFWKSTGDKWFDDYDLQKEVIIDEFYGWLPYAQLLRLLDRYPMTVETKGGSVNFAPEKILIAANSMPDAWYNWNVNMQFNALKRRIDNMLIMEENGEIRVLKGENPFIEKECSEENNNSSSDSESSL